MAEGRPTGTGLIDLEKELTCSICTDILFQPLTLLDCLHTFCGACLQEWFAFSAESARHSDQPSRHPYTCPSCRATVRGTKHNATVTTLLDMYLQANPGKGKSEKEKEEMVKMYKPGDDVLPKIERRSRNREVVSDDEEDRALLSQVREMSLREVGVVAGAAAGDGRRRPPRSQEESRRRHRNRGNDERSPRVVPARQIEHQSSLRSLLSASEDDSQEVEAAIMRQIVEEGLLEGIDVNNMTPSQEEELTEMIAQAYYRRRRELAEAHGTTTNPTGSPSQSSPRPTQPPGSPSQLTPRHAEDPNQGRHSRSRSSSHIPPSGTSPSRHPPVSFRTTGQPSDRHRRSSSQGASRSGRSSDQSRSQSYTSHAAARSATDLSNTPETAEASAERRSRPNPNDRRSTDPERARPVRQSQSASRTEVVATSNSGLLQSPTSSPRLPSPSRPTARQENPTPTPHAPDISTPTTTTTSPPARTSLFTEPSITCSKCATPNIQYTLHHYCPLCNSGSFHLCHPCYRLGAGCLHYFGAGPAARLRFDRAAPPGGYPADYPPPHTLTAQRYARPKRELVAQGGRMVTEEDPATRVQRGVFCDVCSGFANECYWQCGMCNDGAWGYCNSCVVQAKHCTHALLPLSHTPEGTNSSVKFPSAPTMIGGMAFAPLEFTTACDVCRYPIPPSRTRFHCPDCQAGNFDICAACYSGLVASGAIAAENGEKGWRRCPSGHRMEVVGFEERGGGGRRVVVREVVGGWALKDEETRTPRSPSRAQFDTTVTGTTPRFPPDGGVGLRVQAHWGWFPEAEATNELAFPKGAEIREVEDINGDWFWGVFCREKGLFPANYGRVL
ncbi:hypothetical protein P152DRAFT_496942 [Eremomyces bilateralis CBS 781.70]|uniref:RING-type domain-containing protein n=1 Tax=Eremomyces bilateralis CBS 781.70 TaxID=1392243 RepID=A0A6G1FST9_9PEZI|nr:uncharacterized protein P152DRAFT_496942 [Eremomyces bilateralis CBS 781.70]KAF1808823.1 hypothetical protein P152DRAFT_496942 [Eremomyces bilateralis CBS 781.70]